MHSHLDYLKLNKKHVKEKEKLLINFFYKRYS